MNPPYVFTPEAASDLESIWQYVANEADESTADRVIEQVFAACDKLSEMPGIGHFRGDLLDQRHRFWGS